MCRSGASVRLEGLVRPHPREVIQLSGPRRGVWNALAAVLAMQASARRRFDLPDAFAGDGDGGGDCHCGGRAENDAESSVAMDEQSDGQWLPASL